MMSLLGSELIISVSRSGWKTFPVSEEEEKWWSFEHGKAPFYSGILVLLSFTIGILIIVASITILMAGFKRRNHSKRECVIF